MQILPLLNRHNVSSIVDWTATGAAALLLGWLLASSALRLLGLSMVLFCKRLRLLPYPYEAKPGKKGQEALGSTKLACNDPGLNSATHSG